MIELRNITVSLPHGSANASTILDERQPRRLKMASGFVLTGPKRLGQDHALDDASPVSSRLQTAAWWAVDRPRTRQRDGSGCSLQEPDNQFVASSVRNELLLSLPGSLDDAARRQRLSQAVDEFSLDAFLDRNPHRLSGGEKQRLAFATVWLANPRLLLLDEPTSYLDGVERERLIGFVKRLNDDGVTVVWAAPFVDDLAGDRRVIRIDGGRVDFDGPASAFEGDRGPSVTVIYPFVMICSNCRSASILTHLSFRIFICTPGT